MRFFRLIFFFLLTQLIYCQGHANKNNCNLNYKEILNEYNYSKLNKEWLETGTAFFIKLNDICQNNPKSILSLIKSKEKKEKIFNNFYVKKGSFGKGYINVFYNFIFKKDSLISYRLEISSKNRLLLHNQEILTTIFKKTKNNFNGFDFIFYYNKESSFFVSKENLKSNHKDIEFYASPYSGIQYGCRGGYGNLILNNRCFFKQIKDKLDTENLIYIMYSINPASRLTGVEYYLKNKDRFSEEDREKISIAVEDVFKSFNDKNIPVLKYDMMFSSTPRKAIENLIKNGCF